ncbi:hypothetical protein CO641_09575 [Lysobacteraceae bacterium NML91-0213]|nr:hypothetical protein CO641_09575 [Xanthomonadaceae bacterium NML91-0213]
MIARALAVLLVLTACVLPPAVASPVCDPDGTQLEMNACAQDELEAADAELNAVYRQIMQHRKDEPVFLQKFRAAQRLWVQLRDADLEAQFPLADGEDLRLAYGSIHPLEYASAKTEITRARAQYLRTHLPDRSGR